MHKQQANAVMNAKSCFCTTHILNHFAETFSESFAITGNNLPSQSCLVLLVVTKHQVSKFRKMNPNGWNLNPLSMGNYAGHTYEQPDVRRWNVPPWDDKFGHQQGVPAAWKNYGNGATFQSSRFLSFCHEVEEAWNK